MRRVLSRTAALLGAVFAALLIVSPLMIATAQTPQTAEDVLMEDEAWFFRARQPLESVPEPEDPTGNQVPAIGKATVRGSTNPYKPETLHVGVVSGEPEAATFLALPLMSFTDDGMPPKVTGGTVTLVDGGSGLGSKRADASEMVACLSAALFQTAQGGDWKDLPAYDCKTRATVQLVEGSSPLQWTIDLAPFAGVWSDPAMNYGIAIVPDPDSARPAPDQSWHVAFQAKNWQPDDSPTAGEQPAKAPVTADVRFVPEVLPDFGGEDFSNAGAEPDFGGGSGFVSDSSGFADDTGDTGFDADLPSAAPGDEVVPAQQPESAVPPVTQSEQRGIRTNPAVYLLPFVGLGLAGLLGYSLSHDPELPTEREGAVSRLLARRATRP